MGVFLVANVRKALDDFFLSTSNSGMRWNTFAPRKANIFIWSLMLNRFPVRQSLVDKGIDVPSVSCHVCNGDS